MLWISFAPIAVEMSLFYDVHVQWINTLSTVCLLMFPFGMVWCSYITGTCGLRQPMVIASGLNLIGGMLRLVSYPAVHWIGGQVAYTALLVGQVCSAFAQPIFTNTPLRVANEWFPQDERDKATTFGNCGFGVGNVVGFLLPSFFVSQVSGTEQVHGIGKFLAVESGICLLSFLWCWRCFLEEPEGPPSHAAVQKRQARQQTRDDPARLQNGFSICKVFDDYIQLLQDKNFCALLVAFSFVLGGFNSLFTVLEQLLKPAGYSIACASDVGNTFIVSGGITSVISALILDRTHAYITVLKVSYFLTFVASCIFCSQVRPDNDAWLVAAAGLFGAASVPILPVTLEAAAEATYPVAEEAASGLLILGGNYLGAVFTYIVAALVKRAPIFTTVFTPASFFTVVILSLATLASCCFNGTYKRQAAEAHAQTAEPLLKVEDSTSRAPQLYSIS